MLLTPRPPEITTHEQNLSWSFAEIFETLYTGPTSTVSPHKITEADGYFPSDVLSYQPLRTIDGGNRYVLRMLLPVNVGIIGKEESLWRNTLNIVA